MASRRAKLESLRSAAAPESFDPADVDALGDNTGAKKRRKIEVAAPQDSDGGIVAQAGGKRRLPLRAPIPTPSKYKGERVSRGAVFGDDDESGSDEFSEQLAAAQEDDDASDEDPAAISSAAAGGMSIPADIEKEYAKLMQQNQSELEVMRAPSKSELAKRQASSQLLKRRMEAWSALLEMRIHLEGALSIGHRLPAAASRDAVRSEESMIPAEEEAVDASVRGILGSLSALQQRFASTSNDPLQLQLPEPRSSSSSSSCEAAVWETIDARTRPVLDWALHIADDWKERTRLDVRSTFKVLDQSLSAQMRAVDETAPEKVRQRCTPPPGRHAVIGAAANVPDSAAAPEEHGSPAADNDSADIYDDREFYVQLLREVLAGGGSGAAEAKDFQAELQGRRARKKVARTDVERRASKGRKIRYVPIERLQNFMAPRPRKLAGDHEGLADLEASLSGGATVDALMQSLFAQPRKHH